MAANPVQIVLNAQNYVQRVETPPGGSNKDFFEGRDAAFVEHRRQLAAQASHLSASPAPKVALQFVHVDLDDSAWAKSHRPTKALFNPMRTRSMGGNDLGTLIVEIPADELSELPERILKAESETRWATNQKTGKLESKPSRLRSEVGAIRKIRPYGPQDRRKFSIEQALTWLADPRTGSAYYVETFASADESSAELLQADEKVLLEDLKRTLQPIGNDIEVSETRVEWCRGSILVVKVNKDLLPGSRRTLHGQLIRTLESHPIVRSILLPPILQSASVDGEGGRAVELAMPLDGESYPVLGIIDTGVAKVSGLQHWCIGRSEFIDEEVQDLSHGTFIAGLASGSSALNSDPIFGEIACKYYDIGLHPTENYDFYFPRGFLDFLEQLDVEIARAREVGVRVFNMSLSVTLPVEDANYSLFANAVDRLADKHKALFVLPAGNLESSAFRDEWPSDPDACLKMLAEYRHQGKDRIFQPADSLRSLVVGAMDPPTIDEPIKPARYTRRGPGPSLGAKPDLAHVGGSASGDAGLFSIGCDGKTVGQCGTSYASPLVAKTLAALDRAVEGPLPLEALAAIGIHNAEMPASLSHRKLANISKDFAGAGIPKKAVEMLVGGDDEITLVFNGVLQRAQELSFGFSWPAGLVTGDGACRGNVRLTLIYSPPIDRRYGAEFVLVNLDAWLRQEVIDSETGEISFKNRLKNSSDHGIEKERVAHGAKWWPVKRFNQTFPRGVGRSSQWRLVLESLCRSDYSIDDVGIPFSVVLTIADPEGEVDVFNQLRQQLGASGVQTEDIRVALSNQLRIKS